MIFGRQVIYIWAGLNRVVNYVSIYNISRGVVNIVSLYKISRDLLITPPPPTPEEISGYFVKAYMIHYHSGYFVKVEMAAWWPKRKKELGQYAAILTKKAWSIQDLLHGKLFFFFRGITQEIPS